MEKLRYIPKTEMKDYRWYHGICRNTKLAMWNPEIGKFIHLRNKFNQWFKEEIEHFDDVKEIRLDGFVPVKEVEELDFKELKRIQHEAGY